MTLHLGSEAPLANASLRPSHNLTAQPTTLLGRQREVELMRRQLLGDDPPVRLLTLTGPGGTGKTRLAHEIAWSLLEQFEDGVFFVDLVPLQDAQFVASAIARTLRLRNPGDQPLVERLQDFIADKSLLLVLDNFEHVVEAASDVSQLLTACPNLKVLATSRARLRLRWEHVVPVSPLEVPDLRLFPEPDALARVPSVALFLQRAQAIDPSFTLSEANAQALAELCVRLDGLPLALELAAARVDVLSPHSMLSWLDRPLELLAVDASDVPPRHATMRLAIGWSYDLLAPHEKALFRRMAIFSAGCLPEAAAAVCGAQDTTDESDTVLGSAGLGVLDGLASLAGKSLLRRDIQTDGALRFGMLETIRAFALERLAECGEMEDAGRRFRDFFLAFAEQAEPDFTGPRQGVWLDDLEREHDNLRSALRWCLDRGAAEEGSRLAGALWRFWFTRRHLSEGSRWLDECLHLQGSAHMRPETRAKALNGAGNLAQAEGDLERAAALHQESLAVRQALGDRRGIAISLNSLANVAVDRGDYNAARALHEDSLALRRDLGDERGIAIALNNLSVIARDQGDWERAAALSHESAELFGVLGDKQGVALSLVTLGAAQYHLGAYAEATASHQQSLAVFSETENRREIAECLEVLAMLAQTDGYSAHAARLFAAAEAAFEEIGSSMRPSKNPRYEGCVAELRAGLGEDGFAAAWGEGRAMRLEDAMAAALETEQVAVGKHGPSDPILRPATPPARASKSPSQNGTHLLAEGLTRREQDVAALLARGLTNQQIAAELTISQRTAETHVCNILSKLGLHRRAQLTAWAVEHALQST